MVISKEEEKRSFSSLGGLGVLAVGKSMEKDTGRNAQYCLRST